jgi:hypothetical protein
MSLFLRLINNEVNRDLYRDITKEEFQAVISNFRKDKSLGPDGWKTKLFEDYFDIVGDDLLQIVEEVRTLGNLLHSINSNFLVVFPKTDCPYFFMISIL